MHIKPTRVFVVPPSTPKRPPPPKAKRMQEKAAAAERPPAPPRPPRVRNEAPPREPIPPPPPAKVIPPIAVGSDYALVIDRVRPVSLKKLGESVEVTFKVDAEPREEPFATGQFPLSGKGLAVLVEAALGQPMGAWEPALLEALAGKKIRADIAHVGHAAHPVAVVRNIRALA